MLGWYHSFSFSMRTPVVQLWWLSTHPAITGLSDTWIWARLDFLVATIRVQLWLSITPPCDLTLMQRSELQDLTVMLMSCYVNYVRDPLPQSVLNPAFVEASIWCEHSLMADDWERLSSAGIADVTTCNMSWKILTVHQLYWLLGNVTGSCWKQVKE